MRTSVVSDSHYMDGTWVSQRINRVMGKSSNSDQLYGNSLEHYVQETLNYNLHTYFRTLTYSHAFPRKQ